jgi:hypothetical protein
METNAELGKFLCDRLGLDEDDAEAFGWTKICASDVIGKSVAELSYILVVSRFPRELAKRVSEALVAALCTAPAVPDDAADRWPLDQVQALFGQAEPLAVPLGLAAAIGELQAAEGAVDRAAKLGALVKLLDGEVADVGAARLVGDHGEFVAAGLCRFAPGAKRAWEDVVWLGSFVPSLRDSAEQNAAAARWEAAAGRILEHQPGRASCLGWLSDGRRACFVRAERTRLCVSESVTLFAPCDTGGGRQWELTKDGELLLRFLALTPEQMEFQATVLPVVLGVRMEACLRRGARAANAVYLAGGRVFKVGASAAWEVSVMEELRRSCCLKICPAAAGLADCSAFAMEQCEELRAQCRTVALDALAASLFWKLYEMHQSGVIHADVKPSNVLCDSGGEFLFTDFDATVKWMPGLPEPLRARLTKHFAEATMMAVVSPRDWDLEGLFWTLVYVWARQQDPPMAAWDGSVRQNLAVEAAASWGPLQRYFSDTLGRRQLLHPSVCMAKYVKARSDGDNWESWRDAVRAIEACNGWLCCPDKLLQKVFAEGAML